MGINNNGFSTGMGAPPGFQGGVPVSPFVVSSAVNAPYTRDTFEQGGEQSRSRQQLSAQRKKRADDIPIKPFTFWEGLKAFAGGIISPITDPFKNPEKFLIFAGLLAAHMGLIAATGGAAAPFMLVFGGLTALYQGYKGLRQYHKVEDRHSKNPDKDKKEGTYHMGESLINTILLVAGAGAALKEGREGMFLKQAMGKEPPIRSLWENIRLVPRSLQETFNVMKDRQTMKVNNSRFWQRQKKEWIKDPAEEIKTTYREKGRQLIPTIKSMARKYTNRFGSITSLVGWLGN